MPETLITFDDAVILLEKTVGEKGADYVFIPDVNEATDEDYWYFNPETGAPGCIVGHALSYVGVTKQDLGSFNAAKGIASMMDGVGHDLVKLERDAFRLFELAQDHQDGGMTWGDSVTSAINEVSSSRTDAPA